jgi:peroxiredoxin Q/BCP
VRQPRGSGRQHTVAEKDGKKMTELAEGAKAPDFDLATDDGSRAKLSGYAGKAVVLYFYPKDDTSGCTLEARDFTAAKKDFDKAGAVVIGISPDSEASHCRFKEKHGLGITLAADPDRDAIDAYGVWRQKSMYGRKYMGVERSTFLIGPDRRIARVWRNVKVPGHVEDVLAAVRAL